MKPFRLFKTVTRGESPSGAEMSRQLIEELELMSGALAVNLDFQACG